VKRKTRARVERKGRARSEDGADGGGRTARDERVGTSRGVRSDGCSSERARRLPLSTRGATPSSCGGPSCEGSSRGDSSRACCWYTIRRWRCRGWGRGLETALALDERMPDACHDALQIAQGRSWTLRPNAPSDILALALTVCVQTQSREDGGYRTRCYKLIQVKQRRTAVPTSRKGPPQDMCTNGHRKRNCCNFGRGREMTY
jgi:hypothetical protein